MPRTNNHQVHAVRRPLHAGSWYEGDASVLDRKISDWLDAVPSDPNFHIRALIGPHAGYRYCGHVMAHAYKHIKPETITRVFVLGPSHHLYSKQCLLSMAEKYSTPLGDAPIDQEIYAELMATGKFELMNLSVDEEEHSLELHMPFVMKAMGSQPFKLVPIMVGALTPESEAAYGKVFGPYLDDQANFFVVSSDFCHWGQRFNYMFHDKSKGAIYESVEWLDREGMRIIEGGQPAPFTGYLRQYHNTICGRHPIGVFLNMIQNCSARFKVQFRDYDQSSRCTNTRDSSVSYAAAVVTEVKQ